MRKGTDHVTYLTARFLKKHPRSFGITEIIRTSDFVEGTCARASKIKNFVFFLLSARLFVSLQAESGGESLEGRLTKRMAADKADVVRQWRRRGGASGP